MFKKFLLIYLLSLNVLGYADSYINVDYRSNGLCYSVETIDNPVCENQTLILEGTSDHLLYILPAQNLKSNSTVIQQAEYMIFTPLNILISIFGIIGCFIILIISLYLIAVLINSVFVIGK